MHTRICVVHHLGRVPYQEAWDLQIHLAEEVGAQTRPPTLLLLEHPHTFTFGRRGRREHLLWDDNELAQRGVSVHWVDRGGDVTYHGPGQLVGYPIIPLVDRQQDLWTDPGSGRPRIPRLDYIGYLRKLEEVLIRTLARLGVDAAAIPGLTGVWVPPTPHAGQGALPAKIAAIGVRVDGNGVTRHGFALNVAPDMTYWEGIIGCGLAGYPVTSLAEQLAQSPTMEEVMATLVTAFGEVFACQMVTGKPVSHLGAHAD